MGHTDDGECRCRSGFRESVDRETGEGVRSRCFASECGECKTIRKRHGLFWLTVVAVVLLIGTAIYGWVKRKTSNV